MKRSVKELETDLKNFRPHNEEDRFADVMTVSFNAVLVTDYIYTYFNFLRLFRYFHFSIT